MDAPISLAVSVCCKTTLTAWRFDAGLKGRPSHQSHKSALIDEHLQQKNKDYFKHAASLLNIEPDA